MPTFCEKCRYEQAKHPLRCAVCPVALVVLDHRAGPIDLIAGVLF